MGATRTDIFSESENRLAEMAKALSHPARIAILNLLAKSSECVCGEIVAVVGLAQSTVSQHLKELKKAGVIKGEVEGVKTCYCLNTENLAEVRDKLTEMLNDCCTKPNCC